MIWEDSMTKKTTVLLCICTAVIFAVIAAGGTYFIMKQAQKDDLYVAGESYSRLMEFFELDDVSELIDKNYHREVETDQLLEGALEGVIENLGDGYSRFYPERYFQYFDENTEGSYLAQGMLVDKDSETGYIIVNRVFADTPAFEQNIVAGNYITAIDGMDTREMDAESAVSCLRGKNGVDITLDVLAGDSAIQLTFVRKSTNTQVVFSDMLESGVGYIDIMEFSGSAESDFKKALKTMENEEARAIIIDIRNVPGGYISQASAIADMLIESGDIYTTKGRDNAVFTISAKSGTETNLPIYLLVNEETKGVAEVFAAALHENGIAKVIGMQTYGKGVVMATLQVPNSGDGVRIVTAFYHSPKGNPINEMGVTPDEIVEDAETTEEDQQNDPQLDKALEMALADLDQ